MTKYVKVKFPNGDEFKIPADIIARSRATYYANHDEGDQTGTMHNTEEWQKVYDEEYAIGMKDDYELTDWLWNNMDWKDVAGVAIKLTTPQEYDYGKHWMEITEDDDNYEVIIE